MTLSLGKLSLRIDQDEIRAMSIESEKPGRINLAQKVCDTQVPLLIRESAHRGIENGINSYTRFDGLAELREAISRFFITVAERPNSFLLCEDRRRSRRSLPPSGTTFFQTRVEYCFRSGRLRDIFRRRLRKKLKPIGGTLDSFSMNFGRS